MKVIAQVLQLDPKSGNPIWPTALDEVEGTGATYAEARASIAIPAGWQLCGWIVPEHLEQGTG